MTKKLFEFNKINLLLGIFFISAIFAVNSYSILGTDCWSNTGNYTSCTLLNSSCFWSSNNASVPTDPYCMINSTNYNSSLTIWVNGSDRTYLFLTGNLLANAGCCNPKMSGGGGSSGTPTGCWGFDGNYSGCQTANTTFGIMGCNWQSNNANQNPSCYVKKVGDWANGKAVSNTIDIGCCQKQGCYVFSGTQTATNNCTSALGGICSYMNSACSTKSCNEVSTENACLQLAQLDMPCIWNSGSSTCSMSGGGFGFFNNSDSCMSKGGWWNSTGSCVMPGAGTGGGGFMFAQEARCWFGDNKQSVCGNVTGCVYCSDATTQINNASSVCYQMSVGMCHGHEPIYTNWNGSNSINVTDINTSSMICSNLKSKQVCSCGPLPNCRWTNSSTNTEGAGVVTPYCEAGMKTNDEMRTCQPPAMFCEDNAAKNNQTLCNLLASDYMMPCKWDSTANCTFNNIAVFGSVSGGGGGMMNYNVISSSVSCIAAGGTWKTENYIEDGNLRSDSWCDKGALFDFSSGTASSNKGSCNSDCWACEFQSNGTRWGSETDAMNACRGSAKGYCMFEADSNAPNGLGWCDYPKDFETGGMKDCSSDCKACEFMGNSTQAPSACSSSSAGCSWINDTNSLNGKGGYCMSSSKKSCTNDCFSCYDQLTCSNSTFHIAMNCSWDSNSYLCKPQGFTGEICFNGIDDDNDGMKDCADTDCTYDQFCGGASTGGSVDCKKIFVGGSCSNNRTASGANCTWVNVTAGGMSGQSYCDFPGSDCWMYDSDITRCRQDLRGCIYRNATGGYPNGPISLLPGGIKSFSGFCDINKTKSNICFNSTNMNNVTLCSANDGCTWMNDSYSFFGGRCEFKPYALCGRNANSTSCSAVENSICNWRNNSYSSSGGYCEPSCMGRDADSCSSGSNGFCVYKGSTCEPEAFGGMMGGGGSGGGGVGGIGGGSGCHINDGNITGCAAQNMTCAWMPFSQNISQGICEMRGMQTMMQGMDTSPPKILGQDSNDTNPSEVDIREYGIKDTPSSLGFGIIVTNITNGAVCRGYYVGGGPGGGMPQLGNGTATTKYHWFLDTNKNLLDGCNGTNSSGSNMPGFEFMIKYVIVLDNVTVSETKSLYKCSSGNWVLTNVPITSNRQKMCEMSMPGFGGALGKIGGVMILVDRQNLESFSEYNKSAPMRVFVSSANASTSELNPLDSANPGYYTSGSADFKFVDCGNPSTKDTKCKNFQKYGVNIIEDCKNGKDDDSNSLTDCADPICKYMPGVCVSGGTAFNFVFDANDVQSPTVTFSQVDVLRDSVFVKFDTDEPANGTVDFYSNDSTCNTINISKVDVGNPSITFDDFKPFHLVALDLNSIGYSLLNGTLYYYKTSVCDPSNNCATSACQNFTTSNEAVKNFIFKMKLPPGFNVSIPVLNYNGNFTTNIGGVVYETGIKTNATVARNLNITVNCGNQSLTFIGADILKPKSIDMTNAFVCDPASNILGMNSTSKSWNQLIGDIGMGGQSDLIKLSFPVSYSASNTINWCSDNGVSNCTAVNSYTNCSSGGTGKTNCNIPTSLGFSAYTISVPGSSTPSTGSSGGGGGGGGATLTPVTKAISDGEFKAGISKDLAVKDKLEVKVSGEVHHVSVTALTATSATIEVSSTPQQAVFYVNDEKKFDVNSDNYYDIFVRLNSIKDNKASITIRSINEKIAGIGDTKAVSDTGKAVEPKKEPQKELPPAVSVEPQAKEESEVSFFSNKVYWVLAVAFVLLVLMIVFYLSKKNEYVGSKYITRKR